MVANRCAAPRCLDDADRHVRLIRAQLLREELRQIAQILRVRAGARLPLAAHHGVDRKIGAVGGMRGANEVDTRVVDKLGQVAERECGSEILASLGRCAVVLLVVELHVRLPARHKHVADVHRVQVEHRLVTVRHSQFVWRLARRQCVKCGGEPVVLHRGLPRAPRAVASQRHGDRRGVHLAILPRDQPTECNWGVALQHHLLSDIRLHGHRHFARCGARTVTRRGPGAGVVCTATRARAHGEAQCE